MNPEVIVVGAGPVGMTAAALLDAAGVTVRVLERGPEGPRQAQGKATTIHPRTLELLDAIRTDTGRTVTDELLALGRPTGRAHFAVLPELLDYRELPTPYPFVLMLGQHHTEAVLARHLSARGVDVRYTHEVTAVEQDADGARVYAGAQVHEARYVLGADGARSVVRGCAGIDYPGTLPSLCGFVADVRLADPPAEVLHHWTYENGWVSITPLPDGLHRVFGARPGDAGLSPEQVRARQSEGLTEHGLREILHGIAGTDFGLREVTWKSTANDGTRRAERYRTGRVFLAGDAAHIHLPAGGQGLNAGIQDAANLAWKLAAELGGRAPAAITEGEHDYHSERARQSAQLARNTLAQSGLMTTFTPAGSALRELFTDLITGPGGTGETLARWLAGLDVRYPGTATSGERVPDLRADGESVFRLLRPDRFLIADATPAGAFTSFGGQHLDVRRVPPSNTFAGLLVRPDGHIARVVPEADVSAMAAAVRDWLVV